MKELNQHLLKIKRPGRKLNLISNPKNADRLLKSMKEIDDRIDPLETKNTSNELGVKHENRI